MSRWGSIARIAVAFVIASYTSNWALFASQVESERQRRKRDKANQRARAAFNEAQKDRLQMFDLQPDAARTLCLGRVRYVEGLRDLFSSGTHSDRLTMIVSYAGHEVDAVEAHYFDDMLVTLDGSGYVNEPPYGAAFEYLFKQDTGTADSSGAATVSLSFTPWSTWYTAAWVLGSGPTLQSGSCSVSVSGTTATVTGARPNSQVRVNYRTRVTTQSYARVRSFLGTAAQNIGDTIDGEFSGQIGATDKFAGIACDVVDLWFNPDVYPQGPVNKTTVLRGAKCYDPRLDSTVQGGSGAHRINDPTTWAWSECPPILVLRYALWTSGCALAYGRGITDRTLADVIAAANRSDTSTTFTLRLPDNTTTQVQLPRHRCGIPISADADPRASMDAIVDTMAGEWAFDGQQLRVRAGMMAASVASIDQTWLVQPHGEDQGSDDDPILVATQSINRELRWNRVIGKCIDPAQRYQMLPYPAVSDTTLIEDKGEKRGDLDFPGVNHIAHAQHLASIEIRRRQAGAVYVMQCDPRAELLELFDVVTLTLPDYGISEKTMEVIGVEISIVDAPVRLMLREISDALFTVDAELRGVDPAPDSSLRAPWDVGTLGTLTVTTGLLALNDGSQVGRAVVTWPAVTGDWIRNGGEIEIQYTRADEALPTADWHSWVEQGNSAQAVITGLVTGAGYLFRGRLVQRLPLVRSAWTEAVSVAYVPTARRGRGLLDASTWVVDTTGSQGPNGGGPGYWFAVAGAGENSIVLGTAPDGALRPLWRGRQADTDLNGPGGGWDSNYQHPIDTSQMYVFDVWWRSEKVGGGALVGFNYLGVDPFTTGTPVERVRDIATGDLVGNPYMAVMPRSALVSGRWYVARGYVLPSTYGGSQLAMSGVWDSVTGQKVYSGADFKWNSAINTAGHRSFQYYSAQNEDLYLWGADITLCDGSEPSIDDLLAIAKRSGATMPPANFGEANSLNGDFTLWADSSTYPDGWVQWTGAAPTKEVTTTRTGPNAARFVASSSNLGMSRSITPTIRPAAGSYVRVSADLYIVSNTSGGTPGVLVRLYTNAGLTTYRDTVLMPTSFSAAWQTLVANAAVQDEEQIYGIQVYCLASWSSMPTGVVGSGGSWTGTVIFDAIALELVQPAGTQEIGASALTNHAAWADRTTDNGTPGGQVLDFVHDLPNDLTKQRYSSRLLCTAVGRLRLTMKSTFTGGVTAGPHALAAVIDLMFEPTAGGTGYRIARVAPIIKVSIAESETYDIPFSMSGVTQVFDGRTTTSMNVAVSAGGVFSLPYSGGTSGHVNGGAIGNATLYVDAASLTELKG